MFSFEESGVSSSFSITNWQQGSQNFQKLAWYWAFDADVTIVGK
jgi:hypothetical protein